MKMSEAFSLPVKAVYERDYCDEYNSNVYDKHGDILLPCVPDDVDCEAIVTAINNHDALVEALKSARYMLWAAKNNMQNDGSPESLELAVMIAKEDLREMDKLIEKFEGES